MGAIKPDLIGTLASQIDLMAKENMTTDIGSMASAMKQCLNCYKIGLSAMFFWSVR